MLRTALFLFSLLLFYVSATAQMIFTGTVKDRGDSSAIASATVLNIHSRQVVAADKQGFFQIRADFDDRLVITAVGYLPDTLRVQPQLFLRSPVIRLVQQFSALQGVTVTTDRYHEDSLLFREEYGAVLKAGPGRIIQRRSIKGPGGFGLQFSPITYFSAKAKARRKLVRQLQYQEEQAYVDYRFSAIMVARYTGLKGDSLRTFLFRYRPTYAYCVRSSEIDVLFYINTSLKQFLNGQQE